MGPAIVSQPDGPRTDALVEAEGDREAIHWRRPSFNLSWGQWAHLDTTTRRGSAKRNAAFTLQHGAMLTTRQPEGCVPVVVSRCAPCRPYAGLVLAPQKPDGHRGSLDSVFGSDWFSPTTRVHSAASAGSRRDRHLGR